MQTATKNGCPECGKKFMFYDDNQYYYGSPVRTCKKCGEQYIDRRYHEIAIEGIQKGQMSVRAYIISMLIGGFFIWRGIHLTQYRMLGSVEIMKWFLPVTFILLGIGVIIASIVEIILISTGKKAEKFEKLTFESEERLRDRNYAWTLKQEGYNVPEQFL